MTIDIGQFYQVFFDEAEELLAEMERLLLGLDVAQPEIEDLNAVFRTAHSVKGGAATFGIADMAEVTHILESLLDRIRQGKIGLTVEHVNAFLNAKDVLKMQLDGHRHGAQVDQEAVADAHALLQSLLRNSDGGSHGGPEASSQDRKHPADGKQRLRIELPELDENDVQALAQELGLLGNVSVEHAAGSGKTVFDLVTEKHADDINSICAFIVDSDQIHIHNLAQEQGGGNAFSAKAAVTSEQNTEQDCGYGFFEPLENFSTAKQEDEQQDASAQPGAGAKMESAREESAHGTADKKGSVKKEADKAGAGSESSSIRVSVEKVDQLINLIGELVITQAMIEQRTGTLDPMSHQRLLNSVGQLNRNTRDLQEAVMSIRMMPMDYVFSRFPRMVRDLAAKLGKKVEFLTNGATTELDKGLIEKIVDPLTHLVRNSIDHGIEMPDTRKAAGKSEAGKLFLSASHQGGHIVIEVCDDGGGLNREKILEKARQQGLATSDQMSDADVWQLIFAPGFSTAEIVTDVSGRGVGMDVVKRNITALGGSVDIQSARGFGTTITISLPLTLAILDGMMVKAGEEIYILPLGYVIESLQPAAADIKHISGKGSVIKVRGDYLPLIPLYRVFDITPRTTDPSQGIVVIVQADGKRGALFIDELVGQQQVVVKNLESNYRKVAGISGATILGDGGVSLILDVVALLRSSRAHEPETEFADTLSMPAVPATW